ncbi:MAG: DNA mismatch repair protein MutS [Selenomonadaceae bacterium]|nr:DNA mismatch repair protein MutS [Selenomonadaceae bacterium]
MSDTPMIKQYRALKSQNPDALLFFRLGDFFEMFYHDAEIGSQILGVTLTSRSKDADGKIPMCGVPVRAVEGYIDRLVKAGYKVAIVDQVSDPKASGLTDREIVRVVTPGTQISDSVLEDASNHYIVLIREIPARILFAGADVSTGECFYGSFDSVKDSNSAFNSLCDELFRLSPREILIVQNPTFKSQLEEFSIQRLSNCALTSIDELSRDVESRIIEHFDSSNRPSQFMTDLDSCSAVATLLDYLHEKLRTDLSHVSKLRAIDASNGLILDTTSMRNLEILQNLRDGGKRGTLFAVLDFTKTAMGMRLLRRWLSNPLQDVVEINRRLDSVEELVKNFAFRSQLRDAFKEIHDFERILTKIEVGSANARDLISLKLSLKVLPKIYEVLEQTKSSLLRKCHEQMVLFTDLTDLLERAIIDEPPLSIREGGIIKEKYDGDLDDLRKLAHDSKSTLQGIEERERQSTGIKSLKIGYNRVFGYFIEIRSSSSDKVPNNYIRKQTLSNAERFITPELKEFETKILGAQEKIANVEYEIFSFLRSLIRGRLAQIQQTATVIATLDTLASFAEAATSYNYIRPEVLPGESIRIKDGRHPVVERMLERDLFVPNDTKLDHSDCEIMLITGPNMAGKSTYMRQVALLVTMAQIGSFIPASSAKIAPVDRIFTRIGASDDLASGQSTFMVEMNEVSQILKYATKKSLVLLDEVGRGTSTFDGMSIARAVLEHIDRKIHAKTLFATHYHELTSLAGGKIKNFCIAVKERSGELTFLRRILEGAADRSYGIHVARLAGLPKSVTKRAEEILSELESNPQTPIERPKSDSIPTLFETKSKLQQKILALDIMSMTPLEALNLLYNLQIEIKNEIGD